MHPCAALSAVSINPETSKIKNLESLRIKKSIIGRNSMNIMIKCCLTTY